MNKLVQEGFRGKMKILILILLVIGLVGLVSCVPLKTTGLEAVKECVSTILVKGADRDTFEECIESAGVKIGDPLLKELKKYLLENYDSNVLTRIISTLFGITTSISADWGDDENKANIIAEQIRVISND